jgi:hypothetical protein
MALLFRHLAICIFPFFLINCFDYEETISFSKGFTGTIEIKYEVPLKDDKKTSLIRHLPAQKEAIQNRLSQDLRKESSKILDYEFVLLEKGQFMEPFFDYKARVSYKLEFKDITEYERFLPGNMIVKSKGRTLIIRREFPSFTQDFLDNMSVGEKKIVNEISKLLKEGSLRFKVFFPTNTECISNKGYVGLGSLSYTYFLSDSLEESSGKIWEYKLRFY